MNITDTERLYIQEASIEDAPFFIELLNTPKWKEYIGDMHVTNIAEAEYYIETKLRSSYEKNRFGLYKLIEKESNIAIGICGFVKRDYLDFPDIGFALLPGYEGKGFAFEAAAKMMTYGKDELHFTNVFGITLPANTASQKLLIKLGMRQIDEIKPAPSQQTWCCIHYKDLRRENAFFILLLPFVTFTILQLWQKLELT